MSFVLDSSASLAWCFEDERSTPVVELLDALTESHAIVPALWRYEFANGLLMAQRRGRLDADRRRSLLSEVDRLDIREDSVPRQYTWGTVSALAERHSLTIYDASYLELAVRLRRPIATLDSALRKAAIGEAVDVLL